MLREVIGPLIGVLLMMIVVTVVFTSGMPVD